MLMAYMVHYRYAHDNGNAAMSTVSELGVAQLGAFDTDNMAWGEQLKPAHRVRVLGKRREPVEPPGPRVTADCADLTAATARTEGHGS
jgi:hypothetical protein